MYKNIIFDVGWVLLSYDWKKALKKGGVPEEALDNLGDTLLNDSFWAELDLGIRPYFEVVEDLCNKYSDYADGIRNFLTNVENMPIGRPKVWEEVHRLKEAGYNLYILSNYSEYMFKVHALDKPFIKDMDGMMVSYMINCNKPDKKIYEALINKYGINPKESIFFDDKLENVKGAIACGIDSVQITSEEFLLSKLKEF